jgi:hypothetical protein
MIPNIERLEDRAAPAAVATPAPTPPPPAPALSIDQIVYAIPAFSNYFAAQGQILTDITNSAVNVFQSIYTELAPTLMPIFVANPVLFYQLSLSWLSVQSNLAQLAAADAALVQIGGVTLPPGL